MNDWYRNPRWLDAPRHVVSAAVTVGRPVGGRLRTSAESIEVAWHPLPDALNRVTWPTFRRRIEMSLDAASWPFLIEYRD